MLTTSCKSQTIYVITCLTFLITVARCTASVSLREWSPGGSSRQKLTSFRTLHLCYKCKDASECYSRRCDSGICVHSSYDVYVCRTLLNIRKDFGQTGNDAGQKKRKRCDSCEGYWECEDNRCINNVCAPNQWVRRRCKRVINKNDKTVSLSRNVCMHCTAAKDCKGKGICVRQRCVDNLENLVYCVLENRLDPSQLRNEDTKNGVTMESIGGSAWANLQQKLKLCQRCEEWHECRSGRCVHGRCVEEEDDLRRCYRGKYKNERRENRKDMREDGKERRRHEREKRRKRQKEKRKRQRKQ